MREVERLRFQAPRVYPTWSRRNGAPSRQRDTSDGRTPVETENEDEGIELDGNVPPEYTTTPEPSAQEYEMNRILAAEMDDYYNRLDEETEEDSPSLLLM